MPVVPFESLPDASRVWVFGADRLLGPDEEKELLKSVDEYLEQWKAHGAPLTVSREWREGRFLVIAVDQSTEGATGCSIDGLFRVLQELERSLHMRLVGGGCVFYRDNHGVVQSAEQVDLEQLAATGGITRNSVVFDTTITDLGLFRSKFERPAKDTWVAPRLPD